MTRVWPIAMIQKPTVIFMVSGFMNSTRIIYLDGRKHTDPDLVIPSFNGESIGHWEGDSLVVDTVGFVDDHHWLDNGIPLSDKTHMVERMRLLNDAEPRSRSNTQYRSQKLGGRVEMDQALETRGRYRYHRSVVPAGFERAYAERDVEDHERPMIIK
jgi:hypothetical protein